MPHHRIYFLSELPEEDQHALSDEELRAEIVKYERENNPADYRQMRRDDELDAYVGIKTRATREYAEHLIERGELPSHAWRRAVRVHIYEMDED